MNSKCSSNPNLKLIVAFTQYFQHNQFCTLFQVRLAFQIYSVVVMGQDCSISEALSRDWTKKVKHNVKYCTTAEPCGTPRQERLV